MGLRLICFRLKRDPILLKIRLRRVKVLLIVLRLNSLIKLTILITKMILRWRLTKHSIEFSKKSMKILKQETNQKFYLDQNTTYKTHKFKRKFQFGILNFKTLVILLTIRLTINSKAYFKVNNLLLNIMIKAILEIFKKGVSIQSIIEAFTNV